MRIGLYLPPCGIVWLKCKTVKPNIKGGGGCARTFINTFANLREGKRQEVRKYPVGVTCWWEITDNEGCRLMNEECI
jgi:hypothetical protein